MSAAATRVVAVRAMRRSRAVWGVAAAVTALLVALAPRYGPHRDELYFVAAGHHPAFGYPDQPPLTPLIARLADEVAHGSLTVLRLTSALVAGVVVLLSADLARTLGGGRGAQLLAALTAATSAGVLAVGHLLSTTTLDLLFWTVVIRLSVAVLTRPGPRTWVLLGLTVGVGLLNKHLLVFLAGALVLGVLVTPAVRPVLRSRWPVVAAAIALAIWVPNLVWQARHGWPQFTLAAEIRAEYGPPAGTPDLLLQQVGLLTPVGAVLVAMGWWAALRRPRWVAFRPVAVAAPVLLVVFAATGGKGYYLLALHPALAAAGAVVLTEGVRARATGLVAAATVLASALVAPAFIPVLGAHRYASSAYADLNEDQLDTIGWPGFVARTRAALAAAPPSSGAIVTSNYGEAGALRWYGIDAQVVSGHNGFGLWGPPSRAGSVLYVGVVPPPVLGGCTPVATITNGAGNEEDGRRVFHCTGPTVPWSRAWPSLRDLGA